MAKTSKSTSLGVTELVLRDAHPVARVANNLGTEANPNNFLLMQAMGPNVTDVLGSAVAAGILLALVGP